MLKGLLIGFTVFGIFYSSATLSLTKPTTHPDSQRHIENLVIDELELRVNKYSTTVNEFSSEVAKLSKVVEGI